VVAWRRLARENTAVGGIDVPEGAKLLLLLASANHDPQRFPDPERFDPHRSNARGHLAFGMGIHYCLGAALARLHVPDQAYAFGPNISFRGPHELRLGLGTAG